MKETLRLFIAALFVSVVSGLFWHFTGADGFSLMSLAALIVTVADNLRLRNLLKQHI